MSWVIDLLTGGLWPYIAAAGAALAAIGAAYFKGRSDAKAKRKAAEQSAKIEALETAREVKADVDQKSDADVRRDLSDWVRDK
jgi:hypothetical protein